MNPLALIPLRAWLGGLLVLVAFIAFGWFAAHERGIGAAKVQAKWDVERRQLRGELDEQRQRNLALQRAAELHYTVEAQVRDRFITRTITEVRDATAPLAACPVGADAVRLLNAAAGCAGQDRPAACGAGDPVRPAH